jgi:membrane protein implicated in regulation of membrane protease activity
MTVIWIVIALVWLVCGIGMSGFAIVALDSVGDWDGLALWRRRAIVLTALTLWPLVAYAIGWGILSAAVLTLVRAGRERRALERERADAMQFRDVGMLDALDSEP